VASNFNSLIDGTVSRTTALGLALADGAALIAEKRKLPKHGEQVDGPLPRLVVCPANRRGFDVPWSTEGEGGEGGPQRLREYPVLVAMIAPGNKDAISHLDDYLDWRQQVARSFGYLFLLGGVRIYELQVTPEVPIDPRHYAKLYDYGAMELSFRVIEPAAAAVA
jgi:hypothetical protein